MRPFSLTLGNKAGPKSSRPALAAVQARKGFRRVADSKGAVRRQRPAPWWTNSVLVCLALTATTLVLYSRVSRYGFIDYDDPNYVVDNTHVLAGLTWETIGWSFESLECANWHPVTWLSHALDCQLFGLNAGAHHETNLIIHVLNALLLFLLVKGVTKAPGASFVIAALFALHPFNVESVVWIAERKNVLSTFFLLLTIAAYVWYVRHPGWKRYLLMLVLFATGLASKPMLVTLPFALLLLDYWPLGRIRPGLMMEIPGARKCSAAHLISEKVPMFVLAVASSFVTLIAQKLAGAVAPADELAYSVRFENALRSIAMYVWKMLVPSRFAIHYPDPFDPRLTSHAGVQIWIEVALGTALIVLVSFVAWRQRAERPYLMVGWFWFLGTLVPVIGIVHVGTQGMADRYFYVPGLGLFVILVLGASDLVAHFKLPRAWIRSAAGVGLLTLCVLSFRQIGYWESKYLLWLHAAEVTDGNYFADDHLGLILQQMGSPDAMHYFEEGSRLAPWDPISRCAIAMNYEAQGSTQDAIREYEAVIRQPITDKFLALAEAHLGLIYGEQGDYEKSRQELEQAARTEPSVVNKMVADLTQSLATNESDETYLQLGMLLAQAGQVTQARLAFEKALAVNPARKEAQALLNQLLAASTERQRLEVIH